MCLSYTKKHDYGDPKIQVQKKLKAYKPMALYATPPFAPTFSCCVSVLFLLSYSSTTSTMVFLKMNMSRSYCLSTLTFKILAFYKKKMRLE